MNPYIEAKPYIKMQGSKLKQAPAIAKLILSLMSDAGTDLMTDLFCGTCVVALTVSSMRSDVRVNAIDKNERLIDEHQFVRAGGGETIAAWMRQLISTDDREKRYYELRETYNQEFPPGLLIALNRAGYNGLMRFNRAGKLNVPYGGDGRINDGVIADILGRVVLAKQLYRRWIFGALDFNDVGLGGVVYADPPYLGLNTGYIGKWTEPDETELIRKLEAHRLPVVVSTYSENPMLSAWLDGGFNIASTVDQFYSVGPKRANRHVKTELLLVKE